MTEEPWNKHTPGDPMPCKCGDSVVEVKFYNGVIITDPAKYLEWDKDELRPDSEITDWRFVERKGEDMIAADPYAAPERETCDVCCGTGIAGHPDSGYTCHRCEGCGGIEPQPIPADPYAALNQHLHGAGDACAASGCTNHAVTRFARWRLCRECYAKLELPA